MLTWFIALLVAAALASAPSGFTGLQSVPEATTGARIDVLAYDLQLTPDLAARSITGTVRIHFKVVEPGPVIALDAGELTITEVRSGGGTVLAHDRDRRQLRIRWDSQARAGAEHTIQVRYHGTPPRGITFDAEREYVHTAFSTSEWMPSIDAPSERARFRLRLTVPSSWFAAGSGERQSPAQAAAAATTHEWRLDDASPAYTYGFAAGRFVSVTERRGRVTYVYAGAGFTEAQLRQIFGSTPDMLRFFESRAGVRYPGSTYTQVLVAQGIGQEMTRLATLPDGYGRGVLENERESWLAAHEVAHQWWGNLVTCRDWRHFWLNEGVATFMVAADKEERYGREAYLQEIERIRARYERVKAAGRDRPLVFDNWDAPTAEDRTIVYQKGAYVLHLLREEMGDEPFWRGIRGYTRRHSGRSVTTEDLQRAMEQSAGRSLGAWFATWVYGR